MPSDLISGLPVRQLGVLRTSGVWAIRNLLCHARCLILFQCLVFNDYKLRLRDLFGIPVNVQQSEAYGIRDPLPSWLQCMPGQWPQA